jgi:hypothetical protein
MARRFALRSPTDFQCNAPRRSQERLPHRWLRVRRFEARRPQKKQGTTRRRRCASAQNMKGLALIDASWFTKTSCLPLTTLVGRERAHLHHGRLAGRGTRCFGGRGWSRCRKSYRTPPEWSSFWVCPLAANDAFASDVPLSNQSIMLVF